jgi:hypothetical protein
VLLGVEIRVLAVSSMWTARCVSVEMGLERGGVGTNRSGWRLLRCLLGGRCPGTPFLWLCQHWLGQLWLWMVCETTDHRHRTMGFRIYLHRRRTENPLAIWRLRSERGRPRRRRTQRREGASLYRCSWSYETELKSGELLSDTGNDQVIYLSSHCCIRTRSLLKGLSFWISRPRPL